MSEFVKPEERLFPKEPTYSEQAARRMYRDQNNTDVGINLLAQELVDLKWLDECSTEREQALRDYANFIIRDRIGIRTPEQLKQLVRYMLSIGQ